MYFLKNLSVFGPILKALIILLGLALSDGYIDGKGFCSSRHIQHSLFSQVYSGATAAGSTAVSR